MQQTSSSSSCLVTAPWHSGCHSLSPAGPGSARLPRTPESHSVGGPCNPPVANLSSQSGGLQLSLTTSEERKEESRSSFIEVILTTFPFLVLGVTEGEEIELQPMNYPHPAAAWPGDASGLLYVIQPYITDTLERFSAPNLSAVGTEPLGFVSGEFLSLEALPRL